MKKEDKQRFTLRIAQANSTELVVILYEMLLCYMDEAQEALQEEDKNAFREALRKARGCLNELLDSLHKEYEPAQNLGLLYMFCIRRLALAGQREDVAFLEEVRKVIVPLRDAYAQIAPLNSNGPVMRNSQAVYAGLTYGKNSLTENMADQGANRGMFV